MRSNGSVSENAKSRPPGALASRGESSATPSSGAGPLPPFDDGDWPVRMASVEALSTVVDELAGVDLSGVPVGSLADRVVALHKQLARLEGEVARTVAVLDSASRGQIEGHVSTASWLRSACSVTASHASGLMKTARWLRDRPSMAQALEAGRIGYAHAQVIASALADLPVDTHDKAEPILLEAAERLDPGLLRTVAARLRETIHRGHAERSEQRDHARRRLHISSTLDGMVLLDGLLDAEAGGILLSALTPLSKPLGPDDTRTPAQRRADALIEIAGQVLKTGHLPTAASHRPNINVTIALDSLTKQPGTAGGELDWAGPVTAETARRIACDSAVTRIVLGPDSEILDVGRANRLVTPAQRKALATRDHGCTWTGCTRPSWWTDAHHVTPWADGGTTDLANLVLLCQTHHRWTHEGKKPASGNNRPATRAGP